MSLRQELIVNALRNRHSEVCKTLLQTTQTPAGETSEFIFDLRKRLLYTFEDHRFRNWVAPQKWFRCGLDALAAIRALAADSEFECDPTEPPQDNFLKALQASARNPQQRFALLTTRYSNPLNIAAPSEDDIREHLLERLMVADRAKIERYGLKLLNSDDLLLKLNLIAINASVTDDFRYLDALNYYYELLPATWSPQSGHGWLRVSFLAFYVRALALRFNHLN